MNAPGDLVQVEVEINPRLLKVLRALAELQGGSLGDLIESMAHAAIAGTPAFSGDLLAHSRTLCNVYTYDPVTHSARAGREGASS